MLVRNTTWTASRDGIEGATFLHPTFYDGQGMMVAADSGFATHRRHGRRHRLRRRRHHDRGQRRHRVRRAAASTVEVQSFDDVDLIQEAFIAGQCDGWSSDASQLAGLRSAYPDGPEALVIFDEVFSKEPLARPSSTATRAWAQAVDWAIFATIQAEEFGITSETRRSRRRPATTRPTCSSSVAPAPTAPCSTRPRPADRLRLPGRHPGRQLRRDLRGATSPPLGLERGVNALWTDGGLQYAPPYR